jgi:hypothetical protein
MSGSLVRFLIAIGFNVVVAVIFHFFGASLSTCWFTFLGLTLFAAIAEVDTFLREIDSKLDSILEVRQGGKASD